MTKAVNFYKELIQKLENERGAGRRWNITSNVSEIKPISLAFAMIFRNMERIKKSSKKLMIVYLTSSNGLGRML